MAGDKADLRRGALLRRASVDPQRRLALDAARAGLLTERLTPAPACVAAYLATPSEPSVTPVLDDLARAGVRVVVPLLRREPDWALYQPGDVRIGSLGIPQPSGSTLGAEALTAADVVIVPGLLGTGGGVRLGRGGGWYDRALTRLRPGTPVWLVLDDEELVESLPYEAHDRPVTAIVTPTRWLDCGNGR